MINPKGIRNQLEILTAQLIEVGLSVDQNFPFFNDNGIETRVGLKNTNISIALRNVSYSEIYDDMKKNKAYNIKFPDGAIVQIMYKFSKNKLINHRLAFFPSPYLEEYQNSPEVYDNDYIYADIIRKDIVPFPIRFDFDSNLNVVLDVTHPMSHLTLGQYLNCRIPVTSPLTPSVFIHFILRNFYNTAYNQFSEKITTFNDYFEKTIVDDEKDLLHICSPC